MLTIFDLPGGSALKLTISRYFTPAGRSIQAQGITPDLIAEQPRTEGEPEPIREETLVGHLSANARDGERGARKLAPEPVGSVPKLFEEDPQGARGYAALVEKIAD